MTTPLDIIKRSLRAIGAFSPGETISPADANDAFEMLNDMLDQWSNEHLMVYYQNEVILELVGSQYIYTIGPGGMVGSSFTGAISGTTLTVSALASGALNAGQIIAGSGVTLNTTITALGTAIGGNGTTALGTYQVNQSQTVTSIAMTSYQPRPLRINSAFVRVNTLDYPVKPLSFEDYEKIGLKTLNGPWPYGFYYQPAEPVGTLYFWPNPSSGEMHMFCDTLLSNFNSLTDTIVLPPGYLLALRFNLAELLMPEYGKGDQQQIAMIMKQAADGRAWIKRINQRPQQEQQFDQALVLGRNKDAGWITHGGFLY